MATKQKTEVKETKKEEVKPIVQQPAKGQVDKSQSAKTPVIVKTDKLEREYVIPLRKEWLKVPMYERTGRAVKAIKKFLAKHMKVEDRDVKKVRLDVYFNNELWFKGRANPPGKIKVKAVKENGIVTVNFVEVPEYVKFLKAKHVKLAARLEKKEPSKESKVEAKKEEVKTEEQKKDEKEKESSVADQRTKDAEMKIKDQKHLGKTEKKTYPQRMALKK